MRVAPSVAVEIVASRRWTWACISLCAAAAMAIVAAAGLHAEASPVLLGGGLVLAAGVGGALGHALVRRHRGRLAWDGSAWRYRASPESPEHAGHLSVMIDLGRWMLLRFEPLADLPEPRPGSVWLPVADRRVAAPTALRAAVYSRALNSQTPARRGREPQ